MLKKSGYLLFLSILLAVSANGQYIDTVCVGTMARGYHVFGFAGSTFSWNITGGTPAPVTNNDTVFVNWGNVTGIYTIKVKETTGAGCLGELIVGDVWVTGQPMVTAGISQNICAGTIVQLSLADTAWCKTYTWTTSGDGTFSTPISVRPSYIPGPGDIAAGAVTLTLSGTGYGAGCTSPVSSSVLIRISRISASLSHVDESCYGYNDGSATVNISGGILPYIFQWNDTAAQTTNPATGLGPGNYSVSVSDSFQCTWQGNVTIIQVHPTISGSLSLLTSQQTCAGDTTKMRIDLTGTPPWTLVYTDGAVQQTINGIASSPCFIYTVPSASSVYSIVSLSDAFCNAVPSKIQGIAPVTVYPIPEVEFTWQNGNQNNEIAFSIDTTITNISQIGYMVLWNFGDGTYGYANNPIHLYPADNVYIVTLTVTDTNGCVNSVTHSVEVSFAPGAFFSSNSPVCQGEQVCFTDLSTPSATPFSYIKTWIWNYGDGSPEDTIHFPSSPDICHTFSNFSLYSVTLKIIDNNGYTDTYTRVVNMLAGPLAAFNHTDPCANQPVRFEDVSDANGGGGIISYEWDFGDPSSGINNTSVLQDPQHTYSAGNAIYTVRLIITNFNNCRDTAFRNIRVRPSPPVAFAYGNSCISMPVGFFADTLLMNIDSIATWSWNFGDGSTPSSNPITSSHTYAIAGSYSVMLTVMDIHGCYNTFIREIQIDPDPVSQFSWNTPLCSNLPVLFTDQSHASSPSGYITQWHWDFGDGTDTTIYLPGNPDVTHTFVPGGLIHQVVLTVVSDKGCVASTSKLLQTLPSPVADFISGEVSCTGLPVQFTDLSTVAGGGTVISRNWLFGDPASGSSNFSTATNPVHSFTTPGSHQVKLVVMSASMCTDTIIKPVFVNPLPVAAFQADSACLGHPTTFTGSSIANSGAIISYLWNFGDGGVSVSPDPVYTYQSAGPFNAQLTIMNGAGCVNDTIIPVYVLPPPVAAFTYSGQNCQGTSVSFTDQSVTPAGYSGTIQRWTWDFGDGSPLVNITYPVSPNISHTFPSTANAFLVTLTVQTSDSCSSVVQHTVTLASAPVAAFSFPEDNCSQGQVQFTDATTGQGITQWLWNFGDPSSGTANSSILASPVHTFSTPGPYSVRLIVINVSGCRDTITNSVSVLQLPVADFSSITACFGSPTAFTNLSSTTSGSISQSYWEFGDGTFSASSNPSHLYSAPGIYQVKLTVTDSHGCTAQKVSPVTVTSLPSPSFTYTSPSCVNDTVFFTDISQTPVTSRTWDFGDGMIITGGPATIGHSYAAPGSYLVKLNVSTSEGCSASTTHLVVIQLNPEVDFNFSANNCDGDEIHFTSITSGVPVSAWNWNFGDPASGNSNTSVLQNPSHIFSGSGTFHITLQVSSFGGCTASKEKDIYINSLPSASFTAGNVCQGSPMQFTDSSVANAPSLTTWLWNFGDPGSGFANTSTLQNPVHVYAEPGNYPVTLTVINSNGCENDTTIQVTAEPKPAALFQYSASCKGLPTHFSDISVSPSGQIISWSWDFGDGTGTSSIQNPDYTYATPGTYLVKLKVTNYTGCTDSVTLPVNSNPAPVAAFSSNSFYCPSGKVDFHDLSPATVVVSRLWTFVPGYTSTEANPAFVFPSTETTYPVSLVITDKNGCSDTITHDIYINKSFSFRMKYDTACFRSGTVFQAENLTPGDSLMSFSWDFNDPASGNSNASQSGAPSHVFSHEGTYLVKLKVTNSDNCADSVFNEVPVKVLPRPDFSYISPDCSNAAQFTDLSTSTTGDLISWNWNFGDGTAPVNVSFPGNGDTSHLYTSSGNYKVLLTVTNSDGCSDTVSKIVSRPACLVAAFENLPEKCASVPLVIHDLSNPPEKIEYWRWIFGDGSDTSYTTYTPSMSHTYSLPGDYQITLVIVRETGDSYFRDSISHSVSVHWKPEGMFTAQRSCAGLPFFFKDETQIAVGDGITREWNFGDTSPGVNNNSVLQSCQHTYNTIGEYPVTLVVKSTKGCTDTLVRNINVAIPPKAQFDYSTPCAGKTISFRDQSQVTDTTISTWNWSFGEKENLNNTASESDPSYKYKNEGGYRVKLKIKDNNGCTDTTEELIMVKPVPLSAFVVNENVGGMPGKLQLVNKSEGAGTFSWDFGNGERSSETDPVITFADDGTYEIMLVSENEFGCTDTIFYKYEMVFKNLYVPNAFVPSSLTTGIKLFKPAGINLKFYHIQVFDEWGHMLWQSNALDNEGRPVEGWDGKDPAGNLYPQGTYMWKISAVFIDGSTWSGSKTGKTEPSTMGTVSLIR